MSGIVPVVDEPVYTLLPERPPVVMVIVVITPAEHDQAFRLGHLDVAHVFQQLLSMSTDTLGRRERAEAQPLK